MKRLGKTWALVFLGLPPLAAQVPGDSYFSDFAFSKAQYYHLVAKVVIARPDETVRYQDDLYRDTERLKFPDGSAFVRMNDGPWMKSDDWGKTGTPVSPETAGRFQFLSSAIKAPFTAAPNNDAVTGNIVWTPSGETKATDATYITMMLTREHPHPDAVHPLFTFRKASDDTDGKLLLYGYRGSMHDDSGHHYSVDISYDYFFPLPADTKIIYGPPPGGTNGPAATAPPVVRASH